jgi:clan AA aspartic protease (TIGR02281 family)
MWRAFNQAFNNFWNPTPELQAAMKLPTFGDRYKAQWEASWHWPVIWRRAVVIFVGLLLLNVGYFAVRGEHQGEARFADALEQAAQQVRAAKPGSEQDSARQNIQKAFDRLAGSANKSLVQFLAEVTHVEVYDDAGMGEFCKRLDLSLCEHADAVTRRARLNVGTIFYCQFSSECFDDLIHMPPPSSREDVPLRTHGGIFVVPVEINGAITLEFGIDSGAADVSIPNDVFSTLKRTGTLKDSDILGQKTYVLADGSKSQSVTFRIRSLKVGDKVVENVTGSVAPSGGTLLLGQSFLGRFKAWSIDNIKHKLVLEAQ